MDIGFVASVLGAARPPGFERPSQTPPRAREASATGRGEGGDRPGAPRLRGVEVSLSAEAQAFLGVAPPGETLRGEASGASVREALAAAATPGSGSGAPGELTSEEEEEVERLKQRDAEVRAHENAHKAAAGQHARGGPTYEFERGPDGRRYAVGGEVQIDTSAVPNDPDATILKMRQVRRAALAPAEPSPQDRRVASEASQQESAARREKLAQRQAESGARKSDAYARPGERPVGAALDLTA